MAEVAIVDTGGANLSSVTNALARLDVKSRLTSDPYVIQNATHVILPGVGAAADSMSRLNEHDLGGVIRDLLQPVLGICLGMQLLFAHSTEGDAECLGIIPGEVSRMTPNSADGITIPHMGWNTLDVASLPAPGEQNDGSKALALLDDIPGDSHYYFVHSYAAPHGEHVVATSSHGVAVPAIVARDNFIGVQFHPERSSTPGARMLRNFTRL